MVLITHPPPPPGNSGAGARSSSTISALLNDKRVALPEMAVPPEKKTMHYYSTADNLFNFKAVCILL